MKDLLHNNDSECFKRLIHKLSSKFDPRSPRLSDLKGDRFLEVSMSMDEEFEVIDNLYYFVEDFVTEYSNG